MAAPPIKYSALIRIKICIFLVMAMAGCVHAGKIDPEQTSIDPNSSVVAFSVSTSKLEGYGTLIRPVRLHVLYDDESASIRLGNKNTGVQRVLLEVPANTILFSQVELVVGDGMYSNRYLTAQGHTMDLTPGEVTYAGRIEVEDIEFEEYIDGSLGRPITVKLVFADAFVDDQNAWEQQYKLFQNRVPDRQVAGAWGGRDYLDLMLKDWSDQYARDAMTRAIDGMMQEPVRVPVREAVGGPGSSRSPNQ